MFGEDTCYRSGRGSLVAGNTTRVYRGDCREGKLCFRVKKAAASAQTQALRAAVISNTQPDEDFRNRSSASISRFSSVIQPHSCHIR